MTMAMTLRELAANLGTEHAQVVPITVFVAVLCLCLVVGHLLEENRWVNESITAILIGCLSGTIILVLSKGKNSHILTFNEELFFIYLLPPIIFNAGFQVKKKQFFQNFFTIMLFGVVGVFISTFIITVGSWWLFPRLNFIGLTARDYLVIGTIFSSTDTVCTLQVLHQDETPLLYSLVFGEGVVNDATSVVLFNAVQKLDVTRLDSKNALHIIGDFLYLFSTSTGLGVIAGLLTSFCLKMLYFGRHSSVREIALMVLMAYLSYMLAELLELSGILTVFFCGILMSHYAWHNVTESSRITTRHVFAMMSFVAETFIFLYVGMDALDIEKWKMTKLRWLPAVFGLLLLVHMGLCLAICLWLLEGAIGHSKARRIIFVQESMPAISVSYVVLIVSTYSGPINAHLGTSLGIYGTLIMLILVGRAAFVFPLSVFSNYMNRRAERSSMITLNHQVVIWWAGLMRGAVSIALAFKQFTYSGVTSDPVNATMVTNTIIVVLFSTLVFGFLTKPLIHCLLPHSTANGQQPREAKMPKEDMTVPMLSMEESAATNILRAKDSLSMLIERPVHTIHSYWRKFDDAYMRPIFGGPCRNNSVC